MSTLRKIFLFCIIILAVTLIIITVQNARKKQDIQQHADATTQFGMQIDIRDATKIPTQQNTQQLNPSWVRFAFPCVDPSPPANPPCPSDYHSTNLLNTIPSGVKKLAILNGESAWGFRDGDAQNPWDEQRFRQYIDTRYIPTVRKTIQDYGNRLDAVELWNEVNHREGNYNPSMPASSFAYLTQQASQTIKAINPNMVIVVGGFVGSGSSYVEEMVAANPQVFSQIDAIGIHPYHTQDDIAGITRDIQSTRTTLSQHAVNKPVWVSEIGIEEFNSTTAPHNQKEFLENIFQQFSALQVPVAIWYSYSDLIGGNGGGINRGLVGGNGAVKQSGLSFASFTTNSSPTSFVPSACTDGIIKNCGFEKLTTSNNANPIDNWIAGYNCKNSENYKRSSKSHSGSWSIKNHFNNPSDLNYQHYCLLRQEIASINAGDYEASAWVWTDYSQTGISIFDAGNFSGCEQSIPELNKLNTWFKLSCRFQIRTNRSITFDLRTNSTNTYWDDVEVKSVNTITPTPLPTNTPIPVPPTDTPIPTNTPVPTAIPTAQPSSTPTIAPTTTPVPPTATPTPLPGDINHDNVVNIQDFGIWRCEFLGNGVCANPPSNMTSNLDGNTVIDLNDFNIWRNAFNP